MPVLKEKERRVEREKTLTRFPARKKIITVVFRADVKVTWGEGRGGANKKSGDVLISQDSCSVKEGKRGN